MVLTKDELIATAQQKRTRTCRWSSLLDEQKREPQSACAGWGPAVKDLPTYPLTGMVIGFASLNFN